MCDLGFVLNTFIFSLVLGPHVMLLHAQDLTSTYVVTASPESLSEGTVTSFKTPNVVTTSDTTNDEDKSTTGNFTSAAMAVTEPAETTKITTAPLQVMTTPETIPTSLPSQEVTTTASHAVHEPTTMMIIDVIRTSLKATTDSTGPKFTTGSVESVRTTVATTTPEPTTPEPAEIPSTAGPSFAPTTMKASEGISMAHSEPVETTNSAVETTPIPILTSQAKDPVSDIPHPVTSISATDPKGPETPIPTSVTEVTTQSGEGIPIGSESAETNSGYNLLIIIIIAAVFVCMMIMLCFIIFIKRRKKSGMQNFSQGHMNGRNQRSKKKKGEDDNWAGPMPLEGGEKGECEGQEEGGAGDDKKPDGTDNVLSTFVALEENGGVGRPGSMEVQKWEEKEPLLYIDEDAKRESREKLTEGVEKTKDAGQKEKEDPKKQAEMKEPKLNGGEAFCLTTAV